MIHHSDGSLAHLQRHLLRRRWLRLEPRLRIELAVIALALGAFAFWQLRIAYAGFAFSHHALGASLGVIATLGGSLVVGGAGTAVRLHQRLHANPAGPAWLSLPLRAATVMRHQRWEAETPLRAAFVLAAAACVAAWGIAPWWVVIGCAVVFPLAWVACCRGGARLAETIAAQAGNTRAAVAPATRGAQGDATAAREFSLRALLSRAWTVRSPSPRRIASREGAWQRGPLFATLMRKDLWLTRRSREVRLALVSALALSAISVGLWRLPSLRAGAFIAALLALAAWGEWLITLGSRDPFAVLRSLPVGPGALWRSRFAWGLGLTLLLVAAHTVASGGESALLRISLVWLAISGLAITALAVNMQLTLFPEHKPALRLFALALAVAVVCSLMIPLLGWAVLLGAVIHSARRLPRWWQAEEAS